MLAYTVRRVLVSVPILVAATFVVFDSAHHLAGLVVVRGVEPLPASRDAGGAEQ